MCWTSQATCTCMLRAILRGDNSIHTRILVTSRSLLTSRLLKPLQHSRKGLHRGRKHNLCVAASSLWKCNVNIWVCRRQEIQNDWRQLAKKLDNTYCGAYSNSNHCHLGTSNQYTFWISFSSFETNFGCLCKTIYILVWLRHWISYWSPMVVVSLFDIRTSCLFPATFFH